MGGGGEEICSKQVAVLVRTTRLLHSSPPVDVVTVDGAVERGDLVARVGPVGVGPRPEQLRPDPGVVIPGGDPQGGQAVLVRLTRGGEEGILERERGSFSQFSPR